MALEMKVYKEIAAYEPKPMFGRTWRQIAALAFMTIVGGGLFAGLTFGLTSVGQTLEEATTVAMYAMFPVLIPAAAWGWWRPKGLMPEQFLGYFFRHNLMRKSIRYDDTFRHHPGSPAGEPVLESADESTERTPGRRTRDPKFNARKLAKTLTEHPQAEAARSRTARRAAKQAAAQNRGR